MSDVKRWDMIAGDGPGVYPELEPDGEWVRFVDHASVEAERDELRAQVRAMLALMEEAVPALQHISDTAQDLESFTLAERFRLVLQAKP